MEKGILYVATGAKYLAEARVSARSVKLLHPSLSICLVTDQHIQPDEDFDLVQPAPSFNKEVSEKFLARDSVAYYRKISPLLDSPFEKTIFLDSDTFVGAPLDDLFTLLDSFDLLVTPAHVVYDYRFEKEEEPFSGIPAAFGQFNTGLLAFRRSAASKSFLNQWLENYRTHTARFTVNDQPAFRLTLFQGVASFHVLPTHYNIISWVPFIVPAGGQIVMLHGRNPWLQKWVHSFTRPDRPLIVGSLPIRTALAYHGARLLKALEQTKSKLIGKKLRKHPKEP
jgi:lipopolysaccharide biosynthesis glycosyltransferase